MPEKTKKKVKIIGGGLAGSQAAFKLAEEGFDVQIFEMRPQTQTAVHKTGFLAELVCSNSFKSEALSNASGLLKEELKCFDCELLKIAFKDRVPAGKALAVDRRKFSEEVTENLLQRGVKIERKEIINLNNFNLKEEHVIVATGPLTSGSFLGFLEKEMEGATHNTRFGESNLYFFDAVSPIISADSVDMSKAFTADRYSDNSDSGVATSNTRFTEGDYINCPLNEEEYGKFYETLINAEKIEEKDFEAKKLFERCQPFEEIANSGYESLRFGPMKPVGLIDPATSRRPYAVVQLRKEDTEGSMYNLVGFQTRLRWNCQKKVLQTIPALREVEILRYGVMHKNSYIDSPKTLNEALESKKQSGLFFAGQITGVEGYLESIAGGLFSAMNIIYRETGRGFFRFPEGTMLGGLFSYVTTAEKLKPMYSNFGLPGLKKKRNEEKESISLRAIQIVKDFISENLRSGESE